MANALIGCRVFQAVSKRANKYGFSASEGTTHIVRDGVTLCGRTVLRHWEWMYQDRPQHAACKACRTKAGLPAGNEGDHAY